MPPLIAGCGGEEPEVQMRLGGKELWFASWVRADPCPGARKGGGHKGDPRATPQPCLGQNQGTPGCPFGVVVLHRVPGCPIWGSLKDRVQAALNPAFPDVSQSRCLV